MNELKQSALKILMLFLVCNLYSFSGFAQNKNPVTWKISTEQIDELTYRVNFLADIAKPYHIYGQQAKTGGLGMPTQFSFKDEANIVLMGGVEQKGAEGKSKVKQSQYSDKVTFFQIVKLKNPGEANLEGTIRFMACTKQMCLLPTTKKFTVNLNSKSTPK